LASETFASDWLALREPVDHRSRAATLVAPLARWWHARGGARVVDLGSGTGSNLRWLSPRLPGGQEWTLVDHDAALLDRGRELAVERVAGVGRVERVQGDLAHEGLAAARSADLVTASALLDLVSEAWLGGVVDACARAGAAALFALTWDGAIGWGGAAEENDALVLDAVRAHQRRDKGLGPALGPTATEAAVRWFERAGYRVSVDASPWVLGPDDRALARALLEGWTDAAIEERPADARRIRTWAAARREALGHAFEVTVGHVDLLALPPA
jgi:SAM-dependent methyltransferase